MECCGKTETHNEQFQPKYEIADIFRNNLDKLGKISKLKWKVVNAIISCRTTKLGGHKIECSNCHYTEISYNSCRNRHCPKCQTMARLKWVEERMDELLPIPYFHVVFSLPDILNKLTLCNKKVIYNILFKTVKETLIEAAANQKNLGAKIGVISVLHTWGQNLNEHPHMHCVVTGGGLSKDGTEWICCKQDFFISVKILSALFRGKFLDYLMKAYNAGELKFYGAIKDLEIPEHFKQFMNESYKKVWITYSKKPFSRADHVLKYLGRYTHRIAISNYRIVNISGDKVSFRYKDYKDDSKVKIMTLDASEFMRRFLLHVLPKGFMKIRFYGILSNHNKKAEMQKCRELLDVVKKEEKKQVSWQDLILRITGKDVKICPKCKTGKLESVEMIVKYHLEQREAVVSNNSS
jgi:hypothetical protein